MINARIFVFVFISIGFIIGGMFGVIAGARLLDASYKKAYCPQFYTEVTPYLQCLNKPFNETIKLQLQTHQNIKH